MVFLHQFNDLSSFFKSNIDFDRVTIRVNVYNVIINTNDVADVERLAAVYSYKYNVFHNITFMLYLYV